MDIDLLLMAFPNLGEEGFKITSPCDARYNCVAWVAERTDHRWWPEPDAYWPQSAARLRTLEAFIQAFKFLGYEHCPDGEWESGFEKVAIYRHREIPNHVARQLADGTWTSKLGDQVDITHTLRGLEGDVYGQVACYLKRPRR